MVLPVFFAVCFLVFVLVKCTTGKSSNTSTMKNLSLSQVSSNAQVSMAKTTPKTEQSCTPNEQKVPTKSVPKEAKDEKEAFKFVGLDGGSDQESIHTNLDSVKGETNPLLSKRVQERLKNSKAKNSKEKVNQPSKRTKEADKQRPSPANGSGDKMTEFEQTGTVSGTGGGTGPLVVSTKNPAVRSHTVRKQASKFTKKEYNAEEVVILQQKKSAEILVEEKKNRPTTPIPKSSRNNKSNHSGYMQL